MIPVCYKLAELATSQDDWGTKFRVGMALSLLVGGKVGYICTSGAPYMGAYGMLGAEC